MAFVAIGFERENYGEYVYLISVQRTSEKALADGKAWVAQKSAAPHSGTHYDCKVYENKGETTSVCLGGHCE
jgi:hypothetical protein